ncbi:MAG TPA: ATP-binding protein [Solirubrobacterales bacterium]|nr:ATP-binding protein [Solirubrobacterales bacterium]
MRGGWAKLGLRSRLAISIGGIVIVAFAFVFVAVRADMADESRLIKHEESREAGNPGPVHSDPGEGSAISPIADAQDEVERTFLIAGGAALVAALLAGYLVAARTAAPLRRIASTAATVDAGDLTPRLQPEASAPTELRTVVEAFNHMLDRLDLAFSRQRRFVSDASHELRTPLTAIRGQLEVLAREETPAVEDVRRVEALALTEIRRVERLVDDLLALARLDEGSEPLLRDVEAASLLRGLAEASPGGTEIARLPEGTVRIDPDLIAQVVRNLLSNAHRHTGSKGRVVLSAKTEDDRLVVAVDDDGPGVPGERREQVFERFHRNQPARDRASGGSGLGLGIARSIVELHGGRIWIEDSPLGGARAAFELPGFEPRMRNLSSGA